jgi:hypothetical protein
MENIREQVQKYFTENAPQYIPNFVYLLEEQKEHIISIGTSIICTRHKIGYPGGSFVQAVVNNDLQGAFATADSINVNCIRFYLMMMYNMPVNL